MPKASNSKLVSELVKIFLLNEEELIKLHKVGKKLPKKKPPQSRYCGTKEFDNISQGLKAHIPGLKISEDKLYALRKYSREFYLHDVKSLLAKAKEHETTLTWSHINYSLSLEPREERLAYLEKCLLSGMSGQQLLRNKFKNPDDRKSEGGRKPRSTLALLERITRLATVYMLTLENNVIDGENMLAQERNFPKKETIHREVKQTQYALNKLQLAVKEMKGLVRRIAKSKRS